MRRYGPPPVKDIDYRDRAGAYGVILRGGEALTVAWQGELLLPGGGIEPGESVLQALHREIYEETGWTVAVERRLGVFQRYDWIVPEGYWGRKVQHMYLCRAIRRRSAPVEPDHVPVFVDAGLAARLLDVEGERAAMAEANTAFNHRRGVRSV